MISITTMVDGILPIHIIIWCEPLVFLPTCILIFSTHQCFSQSSVSELELIRITYQYVKIECNISTKVYNHLHEFTLDNSISKGNSDNINFVFHITCCKFCIFHITCCKICIFCIFWRLHMLCPYHVECPCQNLCYI